MRTLLVSLLLGELLVMASLATAQRPGGPGGPDGPGGSGGGLSKSADVDDLVSRMMAFDENKDGQLTRTEVTDKRLLGLFDRADTDRDGTITKSDLSALAEKEYVSGGGRGPGGPGGFGGPGFGGPGGPPSRPGEVLSSMVQQWLGLSSEQKAQMAELQSEVDSKLAKILNEDQRSRLQQIQERGAGGPGGGPRRGGPGGPGGGPPPNGGGPRD